MPETREQLEFDMFGGPRSLSAKSQKLLQRGQPRKQADDAYFPELGSQHIFSKAILPGKDFSHPVPAMIKGAWRVGHRWISELRFLYGDPGD